MFQVVDLYNEGKYSIGLTSKAYELLCPQNGSYQLFAARVYGLAYPYFLLLMVNKYNGIVERRGKYAQLYFSNREDCDKIVKELNERAKKIIFSKQENNKIYNLTSF